MPNPNRLVPTRPTHQPSSSNTSEAKRKWDVPFLHLARRQVVHDAPVIVVPAHLYECVVVVPEDRVCRLRGGRVQAPWFACCVRGHAYAREDVVGFGV